MGKNSIFVIDYHNVCCGNTCCYFIELYYIELTLTTGYSVVTTAMPKTKLPMKNRKNRLRFIIIMLSVSMLSAMFTASMIYFFQVKNLPSHDWNYIKDNFWIILLTSMVAGFAVAIQFYDHRKQ